MGLDTLSVIIPVHANVVSNPHIYTLIKVGVKLRILTVHGSCAGIVSVPVLHALMCCWERQMKKRCRNGFIWRPQH